MLCQDRIQMLRALVCGLENFVGLRFLDGFVVFCQLETLGSVLRELDTLDLHVPKKAADDRICDSGVKHEFVSFLPNEIFRLDAYSFGKNDSGFGVTSNLSE